MLSGKIYKFLWCKPTVKFSKTFEIRFRWSFTRHDIQLSVIGVCCSFLFLCFLSAQIQLFPIWFSGDTLFSVTGNILFNHTLPMVAWDSPFFFKNEQKQNQTLTFFCWCAVNCRDKNLANSWNSTSELFVHFYGLEWNAKPIQRIHKQAFILYHISPFKTSKYILCLQPFAVVYMSNLSEYKTRRIIT